MHAKYEVSISYGSKVIAKVKVDNRQTNKQTNRQTNRQTDRENKNNMPPIIRSGGIKIVKQSETEDDDAFQGVTIYHVRMLYSFYYTKCPISDH